MVAARQLVPVRTFEEYRSARTPAIAKAAAPVLPPGSFLMTFHPTLAMLEVNAAPLIRLQESPLLVPLKRLLRLHRLWSLIVLQIAKELVQLPPL